MKRFVGEGELGGTIECNIRGQGKIQVGNRNYTNYGETNGFARLHAEWIYYSSYPRDSQGRENPQHFT